MEGAGDRADILFDLAPDPRHALPISHIRSNHGYVRANVFEALDVVGYGIIFSLVSNPIAPIIWLREKRTVYQHDARIMTSGQSLSKSYAKLLQGVGYHIHALFFELAGPRRRGCTREVVNHRNPAMSAPISNNWFRVLLCTLDDCRI